MFSWLNFQYFFEKKFCFAFYRRLGEVYIFEYEECILMTISGNFVTSDYVTSIWYSNLRVLISELNQSKSALHQRWSALNTQFSQFRKTLLNSADSVLILTETALKFSCLNSSAYSENHNLSSPKQSWSALMFFTFSESNCKTLTLWNWTSTRVMMFDRS